MQWKLVARFALALTLLASIIQPATLQAQTVAVPPSVDCKLWPKIRNERYAKTLVQGYLSGRSVGYWLQHTSKVGDHGLDPLGALANMDEAYTWLDGHCAMNQPDMLTEAMETMFRELEGRQLSRSKNR